MGKTFAFECERCGFRARVSGGEDRGAHCFVRTYHCGDCRELIDLVTHLRLPRAAGGMSGWRLDAGRLAVADAGSWPAHVHCSGEVARPRVGMMGRLLPGHEAGRWAEMRVRCPKSDRHRIVPWQQPGRCPRCGAFMETTVMPYLVWE